MTWGWCHRMFYVDWKMWETNVSQGNHSEKYVWYKPYCKTTTNFQVAKRIKVKKKKKPVKIKSQKLKKNYIN